MDLDRQYLQRFDIEALRNGRAEFVGEIHDLDGTWTCPEATPLWNFNLHYSEYMIALAAAHMESVGPQRIDPAIGGIGDDSTVAISDSQWWQTFRTHVSSWISACEYPHGAAWHPYTTSLRLVNWQIARELFSDRLALDREFDSLMQESMYLQYRHLLVNQEKRLLGNHYFENLKTLLIFSRLFREEQVFDRVWRSFEKQLCEQILSDGVHVERSLMYQNLVIEGMIRVALILKQSDGRVPAILTEKIQIALDAAASLDHGMGKMPFFNDSAEGTARSTETLMEACQWHLGLRPRLRNSFPQAGYYKLYDGEVAVMVDAGYPGPSYLLGHAHSDTLSYELSISEDPVIVNSGTYRYQSQLRSWFRSTEAHNTAMFSGHEQMEHWAAHRVGRQLKSVRVLEFCKDRLTAELISQYGEKHQRTIVLRDGVLTVSDTLADATGNNGQFDALTLIHLAPQWQACPEGDGSFIAVREGSDDEVVIASMVDEMDSPSESRSELVDANYSRFFGVLEHNHMVRFCFSSQNGTYRYQIARSKGSQ
ncbi:MAG: heparinase II/III domain-containing protein [Ancrocorticia sp.]